jgi:hypothetical protein
MPNHRLARARAYSSMSGSAFRIWLTTSLRHGVWAPGLVLAFWAVAAKGFDAYIKYPNLDIPTHLFGGLASAYFLMSALSTSAMHWGKSTSTFGSHCHSAW